MTLDEYLADLAAKAAAGNPEKFTLVKVSEFAALVDVAVAADRFRLNGTQETERALYAALARLTALARTR